MLEHFKDTPRKRFQNTFFYFDQKSVPGLKNLLILMLMYFFIYCGGTVFNLCGGHSYQCIHYFCCKRALNSAIFHLFCTFLQGRLVKSKKQPQYIPNRYILKTQCLLLSMFDMYRSLALLYM